MLPGVGGLRTVSSKMSIYKAGHPLFSPLLRQTVCALALLLGYQVKKLGKGHRARHYGIWSSKGSDHNLTDGILVNQFGIYMDFWWGGGPIGKVVILNHMRQAMEKSGGVISRPRLGIGEALNQLLVSVEPTSASNLALPLILSCVNQKSNRSWSIRFWRWCWEVSWRSNRLILFASRVIVGWKTDSSPIRLEYSVCGFYVT